MSQSVSCIGNSPLWQLEKTFWLGDGGWVVDFADALFSFALPKKETCGWGVCHNIASHGFLRIYCVRHATSWVCSHLVRQEHSHIKLFRDLLEATHYPVEHLLPLSQLTPSWVVHSEWRHYWVHYQKRKLVFNHLGSCLHEKWYKGVNCECSAYEDVVQNLFRVEVKSVRYLLDAFGSERILCVHKQYLALTSTLSAG